jgi:hypothetical protein
MFKLCKNPNKYYRTLKGTSTDLTYRFLNLLSPITLTCESMYFKSNWEWRLKQEEQRFLVQYPNYQIIASSSSRHQNYSDKEVNDMISLKKKGFKDQEIANTLARSYWSVVYKLRELRNTAGYCKH